MRNLLLLYGNGMIFTLLLEMMILLVPLHAYGLGAPPALIGTVVALPALFILGLRLPGGILIDRFGSRQVLVISLLLMFLAGLVLAVSRELWVLLLAQCFAGLARSVFWPAGQTYVTRIPVYTLSKRMGWFTAANGSGGVAGPVTGGVALALLGFPAAFWVLSAIALLAVLLALAVEPELEPEGGRSSVRDIIAGIPSLLRVRGLYTAGWFTFLSAIPLGLAGSFYPIYLQSIGFAPEVIGTLASYRPLVMVAMGFLFGSVLLPRLGTWGTCAFATVAGGAALVLTPWVESYLALALVTMALGITQGSTMLLGFTMAGEASPPAQRGVALSLVGTFWGVSLLLVPMLLGFIVELFSLTAVFYFAGGFLLLSSLPGVVTRRRRPAAHRGPAVEPPAPPPAAGETRKVES